MKKTCIIIVGPTAVGKTDIAIELAKHFSTEIISADSRQCYRELNIGVAKPTEAQLQEVKHHFINSHSVADNVNAAVFEKYALNAIQQIFTQQNIAVMVGGTGLYVKAFADGIDDIPAIRPGIPQQIIEGYAANGLEWLQKEIENNDPEYFAKGEIKNPRRLMRALEVKLSTGKSIMSFQTKSTLQRDFDIVKIGLEVPRHQLIERINQRVDTMVQNGLQQEVATLLPFEHLNALQTVGYRELFSHLHGATSLNNAVAAIKINTRQYAKRQMTWFKKDAAVQWCIPVLANVLAQCGNL